MTTLPTGVAIDLTCFGKCRTSAPHVPEGEWYRCMVCGDVRGAPVDAPPEPFQVLLDRSSFGAPEAKAIMAQADEELVQATLRRADELGAGRCDNLAPRSHVGHWRDWHRGHGCELDPDARAEPGNGHDAAPVVVTEPLPNKIVPALEPLPTMRSGGICPKCGPWIDTHPCDTVVESPARTRDLLAQYETENTRLQSRITELERRQEQAIEMLRGGG